MYKTKQLCFAAAIFFLSQRCLLEATLSAHQPENEFLLSQVEAEEEFDFKKLNADIQKLQELEKYSTKLSYLLLKKSRNDKSRFTSEDEKNLIQSMTKAKTLNLSPFWSEVRSSLFEDFNTITRTNIERIELTNCMEIFNVGLQYIIPKSPCLHSLILVHCHNIGPDILPVIAQHCKNLSYCDLSWSGCRDLDYQTLLTFIAQCTKLTYLGLGGFDKLTSKEKQDLRLLSKHSHLKITGLRDEDEIICSIA